MGDDGVPTGRVHKVTVDVVLDPHVAPARHIEAGHVVRIPKGARQNPANQDRDCTDQGYDQHAENEIGRQVDYIVVPVYLIELSHGILPSPRMAK